MKAGSKTATAPKLSSVGVPVRCRPTGCKPNAASNVQMSGSREKKSTNSMPTPRSVSPSERG